MAKATTRVPINANIPEDVEADVVARCAEKSVAIDAIRINVLHCPDPSSSVGYKLGSVDYATFSEELVAAKWRKAGKFFGDIVGPSMGNIRRFYFGIADELVAAQPPTAGGTLAGVTPAAAAAPAAPAPLDVNALLLAQMKQQGDLIIAMLTRPQPAAAPSGINDRLLEFLLTQSASKTPAGDLIAFFDAMKKRTGDVDQAEDDEPASGGGLAVEALRLIRDLARNAGRATPPTPIVDAPPRQPPHNPSRAEAPAPGQERPAGDAPGTVAGGQEPKANPANLDDVGKLRLFGERVVPQLIDYATDPTPSVEAAAAMIEATAIRCGIDPQQFADCDDIAGDIIDPVVGFFPALAPHRDFAIKAAELVAEQYGDDEDDKPTS